MKLSNFIAIGRSNFLYDSIKYLIEQGHSCIAIITYAANDEYEVSGENFKQLATEINSQFYYTKNISSLNLSNLLELNEVNVAISVNWKYVIPKEIFQLFEFGILNMHLGNLPDYKGNATVNWSIIQGEKQIYANVHKMAEELDAGDIIAKKAIPINENTYVGDVLVKALEITPELFNTAIEQLNLNSNFILEKGNSLGLRCYPRVPEDGKINWNESSSNISKLIRASSKPYPGAFTNFQEQKIIIWKAKIVSWNKKFLAVPGHIIGSNKIEKSIYVACSEGVLEILEIEVNGQSPKPTELFKGARLRLI